MKQIIPHNFVDWELTQLLPENNPYSKNFIEDNDYPNGFIMEWYNIDGIITILPSNSILSEREFDCLRVAWTWEDVRLYLQDNGFIVSVKIVDNSYKNLLKKVSVDEVYSFYWEVYEIDKSFTVLYRQLSEIKTFKTYEESRKDAIIYCLNSIEL